MADSGDHPNGAVVRNPEPERKSIIGTLVLTQHFRDAEHHARCPIAESARELAIRGPTGLGCISTVQGPSEVICANERHWLDRG